MEENREFDVVVWGASGFTGQLVVTYMMATYGVGKELKWAIAGRNAQKLEQVAIQAAGASASELPQLIANSDDPDSIRELVRRTRVICTTVGPYALYGSVMVAACAEHGTHYCDLTGEVFWMRRMIDQHQTHAEKSGARIVHACGFDSIPSDLGVYFLQEEMRKRKDTVAAEIKYRVVAAKGGMSGGTIASAINMFREIKRDAALIELIADPYCLNPLNMPVGPDGPDQTRAEYDVDFKQWTAPFAMAGINTRVVRRSNSLMESRYGSDFRYSEAVLSGEGPIGYMKASMIAGISGAMLVILAISPLRSLVSSLAPSPGEGPGEQAIENGSFRIELIGKHPENETDDLKVIVTADRDPGYGATSKMLAESAVCLAMDELEVEGGLWTPASAMGMKLIERLQSRAGMTFQVA